MGKVGGIFTIICGFIVMMIGWGFVYGILASNMLVIFAGTYIIIAIILIALGIYIMHKGVQMTKKKISMEDIYRELSDKHGNND